MRDSTCTYPVHGQRGVERCGRPAVWVYVLDGPQPRCRRHSGATVERYARTHGIERVAVTA